ncbi:MAG TPA: DUF4381 domain-containing protein [Nitrosomonas sp.]|uniref:DUF4381 domain-containing protein n=1 Tax=Nitrosomonas sp. TaxID=42353 RepID=UPI00208C6395|nr:DUF4381 domain-containing protein [Nitrosomonas sp.]GJL74182.1 MAG: hypothetical protein NMNS02_02880 [Nitrosomonas sp.]HNP26106.1 DUF4381 domain-containing protein [Nitrosomonas sp.]
MIEDPLAALRPLHTPPPVGWWPPAPGWWIVLLLVVISVVMIFRYRRRMAPRRAALHELKLLKKNMNKTDHPVALLNQLLKRYALACWPATKVASLTGETWLTFLDTNGGNGEFSEGPGRLLFSDPYRKQSADSDEIVRLITLTHRWIKTNTPQKKSDV